MNRTKRRIIIIIILDDEDVIDRENDDDGEDVDWGLMIEDWELRMRIWTKVMNQDWEEEEDDDDEYQSSNKGKREKGIP